MSTFDQALQVKFHNRADGKRFSNRINNPFIREKERKLIERVVKVAPTKCERILEVGCGEGSNLFYLREYFSLAKITGLDFSPEKINFLNETFTNIKGVCGDATSLPFESSSFDLVFIRDLLHHVNHDRKRVIEEATRVCSENGAVVIFESNGEKFINFIFRTLYPVESGIADSNPKSLKVLIAPYPLARIEFVEASYLIRALGFIFAWPKLSIGRVFCYPIYGLAFLWETLVEIIVPRRRWIYMMLHIPVRPTKV